MVGGTLAWASVEVLDQLNTLRVDAKSVGGRSRIGDAGLFVKDSAQLSLKLPILRPR